MYGTIEKREMTDGPVCWKCGSTKFIRYSGTETNPIPEDKFGVCRGCGRLYKLEQPNLSLVEGSDDPDVREFFNIQEFVAEFVESIEK
jgi:hypothetical protein